MKNTTQFPRNYASSSAANRAVRQYEEKNGKKNFNVQKIEKGNYLVSVSKMKAGEFEKTKPSVQYNTQNGIETWKFFRKENGYCKSQKNGKKAAGSKTMSTKKIFTDYTKGICD